MTETLTATEVQEMVNGLAGRCKDCDWWDMLNVYGEPFEDGWGRCELAQGQHYLDPKYPHALAHAAGAGCKNPRLRCHPTYGCCQWRKRNTRCT